MRGLSGYIILLLILLMILSAPQSFDTPALTVDTATSQTVCGDAVNLDGIPQRDGENESRVAVIITIIIVVLITLFFINSTADS